MVLFAKETMKWRKSFYSNLWTTGAASDFLAKLSNVLRPSFAVDYLCIIRYSTGKYDQNFTRLYSTLTFLGMAWEFVGRKVAIFDFQLLTLLSTQSKWPTSLSLSA